MERFDRPEPVEPRLGTELERAGGRRPGRRRQRARVPGVHRVCDGLTEALIYFLVVFTPWAFGTTQEWSIWTMNAVGYVLGLLLAVKHVVRWRTGHRPARWGEPEGEGGPVVDPGIERRLRMARWTARGLAVLTVLILTYVLISAVNARSVYLPGQRRFEYFDTIKWLPQSYDAASTWRAFFMYLGLASFFWALRDWLLGKTGTERRRDQEGTEGGGRDGEALVPARLRRLLWVMCANGALLAVESILQRLSGTGRLLWLVEPARNNLPEAQFGPYAYRSNAAQYFNVLWPVCLGFWLLLRNATARVRHRLRLGGTSQVLLLPMAVLMAACPIISSSRGGALLAGMAFIPAAIVTMRSFRSETRLARTGVLLVFASIIGLGGWLGWNQLEPRLLRIFEDRMSNRSEIYDNARQMSRDFPVFGVGAGAFGSVYQLYRTKPTQAWAAYVHDDWLETRITLGWIGFILVLGAIALLPLRSWRGGELDVCRPFLALAWLGWGTALVHARFDFPFQIGSIVCLVVAVSAILFTCSASRDPS